MHSNKMTESKKQSARIIKINIKKWNEQKRREKHAFNIDTHCMQRMEFLSNIQKALICGKISRCMAKRAASHSKLFQNERD